MVGRVQIEVRHRALTLTAPVAISMTLYALRDFATVLQRILATTASSHRDSKILRRLDGTASCLPRWYHDQDVAGGDRIHTGGRLCHVHNEDDGDRAQMRLQPRKFRVNTPTSNSIRQNTKFPRHVPVARLGDAILLSLQTASQSYCKRPCTQGLSGLPR
jgi:hypothetical protein